MNMKLALAFGAITLVIGCASARALLPVRFRNGAIAVDMQYLYLIGNKLVKVRATIPGQSWEQTQVPGFARELAIRLAGG